MESKLPKVLKRNSEFLELKKLGRRHWPSNWLLLNYRILENGQIRFGVTASRKVGSAVVRNRLKRWVREHFRALNKMDLGFGAEINVIFKPIDQGFYKGLSHAEFIRVLDRGLGTVKSVAMDRADSSRHVPHDRNDVSGR